MQNLSLIKMESGLLYETIITTINSKGIPNAAPIGVTCKNESEIVLYLFEGTHTLENIKSTEYFIVNILKDPFIFVESTIGDLSPEHFINHDKGVYIKNADAYFSATVTKIKEVEKKDNIGKSKMYIVTASVNEIIIKNKDVEPLNRAIFALIESLIFYSRLNIADERTRNDYIEKINEMSVIINRVGGKRYKKAISQILNKLK